MDIPSFTTSSDPFGTATMLASNTLPLSVDTKTPIATQQKEAAANPFLSGVGNLLGGIFSAGGSLISKATETAVDVAGLALEKKLVGSVSPTGSMSPETAAAQQRAQTSTIHSSYPQWLPMAAAAFGALLIGVLIIRQK